jgi:hypothetical protein
MPNPRLKAIIGKLSIITQKLDQDKILAIGLVQSAVSAIKHSPTSMSDIQPLTPPAPNPIDEAEIAKISGQMQTDIFDDLL